jgi:hypothetical protein
MAETGTSALFFFLVYDYCSLILHVVRANQPLGDLKSTPRHSTGILESKRRFVFSWLSHTFPPNDIDMPSSSSASAKSTKSTASKSKAPVPRKQIPAKKTPKQPAPSTETSARSQTSVDDVSVESDHESNVDDMGSENSVDYEKELGEYREVI